MMRRAPCGFWGEENNGIDGFEDEMLMRYTVDVTAESKATIGKTQGNGSGCEVVRLAVWYYYYCMDR